MDQNHQVRIMREIVALLREAQENVAYAMTLAAGIESLHAGQFSIPVSEREPRRSRS